MALSFGHWFGRIDPDKVEFAAVEQLPLDFITGLQADGGGQGQREIDIKSGLLVLGADGLNFQWICCWTFHK